MKKGWFLLWLSGFLVWPSLARGTDRMNHGILLQSWSVNDTTRENAVFNLRVRRAQVKISSEKEEGKPFWFLMFDPAKATTDLNVLQDLGVGIPLGPSLSFVAGQFKIRTTAEGLRSSSELPLPERSIIGRFPEIGDRREPGILVALDQEGVSVEAMISNGQGPNSEDSNSPKRLTVRSVWKPWRGFELGGFSLLEEFRTGKGFAVGASLAMGPEAWKFRTEAVRATLREDVNERRPSWGVMGELEFKLNQKLAAVLRTEAYSPVLGATSSRVHSLGFNFELKGKNRLSAVASRLDQASGNRGSYRAGSGRGVLVILAFQGAI